MRPQTRIFLDSGGYEAGNLYCPVFRMREKGKDACLLFAVEILDCATNTGATSTDLMHYACCYTSRVAH